MKEKRKHVYVVLKSKVSQYAKNSTIFNPFRIRYLLHKTSFIRYRKKLSFRIYKSRAGTTTSGGEKWLQLNDRL